MKRVRQDRRVWSAGRWCAYFVRQRRTLLAVPWDRGPELTEQERCLVGPSLREFQQGEGLEGRHFFRCVAAYGERTGDYEFIRRRLWAAMKTSIDWHVRGTRYGIRVDTDGLLACGEPGVQLTWMDAKVGDWVVTPRRGKPVEVQALWYNALRIMQDLAVRFGYGDAAAYGAMADKARGSFRPLFWNEQAGCLYDVVDGDGRDAAVRPNQIFAVSLKHRMLEDGDGRRVLDVVER